MTAEKGFYMASVTDEGVKTMHADETAVEDAQIGKMFKQQDKDRKGAKQVAAEDQRKADRQAAVQKRRRCCMIKDVAGLLIAAALVCLTHVYGLYVAIAAITACIVAASCRVIGYVEAGRDVYVREKVSST